MDKYMGTLQRTLPDICIQGRALGASSSFIYLEPINTAAVFYLSVPIDGFSAVVSSVFFPI